MRVIAKFIIAITAVCLAALVFCLTLTQQLGDRKSLDNFLDSAKVYSVGADALRASVQQSLTVSNVDGEASKAIIAKSITTESVRSAAQPLLLSLTDWLRSADALQPRLVFDMSGIKSQLVREARRNNSPEVSFVVTREVQDSYVLSSNSEKDKATDLSGVKKTYQQLNGLIAPLFLAVITGLVLLVLLALRLPHKRLAWPGWALLGSSAIGIVLIYGLPFVLGVTVLSDGARTGLNPQTNQALQEFIAQLFMSSRWYWYGMAAVGAGLVASSLPLAHAHKKNKGRK